MEEELFKQEIEPAEWVKPEQAKMAQQIYNEANKNHKVERRKGKTTPSNIVPYDIRMKGIEQLVTDPQFEKLWKKNGEKWLMNTIGGLYINYWTSEDGKYYSAHPKITLAERDKELKRCADKLKAMFDIIISDISISSCFETAFHDALKKGNFETNGSQNIGAFLNALRADLNGESENGCRRVKTHAAFPRSIREKKKAQRGRFIYQISKYLQNNVYKRYNHALASRILNVLRPDLGKFTPEDVRQYMTNKDKSVSLDK